jgi:5-bromo-4-chloroindolyl phosphate hydrolysis protein
MPGFYGGFFGGMPPIFMIFFMVMFGFFIYAMISSISRYSKNASSPILTTKAKVIAKRTHVSNHNHMNNEHHHHHSTTRYYTTFETEAGQRMELTLSGEEYGLLAEGDEGTLIYQGEWFKQFDRIV